jgi:cytoplasmic iron level regulating protein YaaA (DUF328/UPF0246 family)
MVILLHTSKTMRPPEESPVKHPEPQLLDKASEVANYLKTLTPAQIKTCMKVSTKLASETHKKVQDFTVGESWQRPAIDSFIGDIYSGLQVQTWSKADRDYAQKYLRILSGLYGILRPLDGISPYRLEMGYRLPDEPYKNLYAFWGTSIVDTIPRDETIINLSAVEYTKTITPYVSTAHVITPKFLTVNAKTNEPTFVVVHAKIARGAFTRWLIQKRIESPEELKNFNELGYSYDKKLSTKLEPVFVCKEFGGLGLSVRLT